MAAWPAREIDPPRKRLLKWQHQLKPELRAEGFSRATFTLGALDRTVKLTVTPAIDRSGSQLIVAVSGRWPLARGVVKPEPAGDGTSAGADL